MVMDRMTDEIREEVPWAMVFADDIVICRESKENVEYKLESLRYACERRGMKVNRRKTEYMCVNERLDNGSGTVKMLGEEVAKVEDFKYLGSTVQRNGECGREVKKRVQAGCTDENTGGGDEGGRVEDVTIFIMSDNNEQDQE